MTPVLSKTPLLAGLGFALASCTSVPITSMPRLSEVNPITMDPGLLEVAVGLQEGLALEEEDVSLTYTFTNNLTGETAGGDFILVPLDEPLTPFLQSRSDSGRTVMRYRLDDEQAEALRAARETALNWSEESEGQRTFALAAKVEPCLTDAANPFRDMKFSVYLREDPARDFFTLIKNESAKIINEDKSLKRCEPK